MMPERKVGRSALVVGLSALLACGNGSRADQARPPARAEPAPSPGATAVPETPAPASPPDGSPVTELPSLAPLVDTVKSAVVNVTVRSRAGKMSEVTRELLERFYGPLPEDHAPEQYQRGVGSGLLISPDGLVLTNNHMLEGAIAISVKLGDGRKFDAEVLGTDPLTDVAVIRLKGKHAGLPALALGDSDALKVGDWVVAIGNPFGLASTVSLGIISAKAREIGAGPYDEFLQTDAAINPGNSGGPLFNLKGQVIGINTAIVGNARGAGGTGIGFAVPSNLVKELLPQLEKGGRVTRGYIGVAVQNLTPSLASALGVPVQEGALVSSVSPASPGSRAGLETDDVITRMDGETIGGAGQLTKRVALRRPGTVVKLEVYRGRKKLEKAVTLGTRPDLEGIGPGERPEHGEQGADQDPDQEQIGLLLQDAGPGEGLEDEAPPAVQGALIVAVTPGSAAERGDLVPGMIVVEAGGKPVRGAAELRKILRGARPGTTLLLRVVPERGGGEGRVARAITIPR